MCWEYIPLIYKNFIMYTSVNVKFYFVFSAGYRNSFSKFLDKKKD